MPSSAPVTSGDPPPDGGQPFSEVLSLSAPDLPGSSSSSPPRSPSVVPDEAHSQTDAAPAPSPEVPARGSASSSGERGHRRAGPPGPGLRPAGSAAGGSPAPTPAVGEAVLIPRPGATRADDETAASDADQSQGAPLQAAALAVEAPPPTVVPATASDEPAPSAAATAVPGDGDVPPTTAKTQEDGPGPTTVAGSLTRPRGDPGRRVEPGRRPGERRSRRPDTRRDGSGGHGGARPGESRGPVRIGRPHCRTGAHPGDRVGSGHRAVGVHPGAARTAAPSTSRAGQSPLDVELSAGHGEVELRLSRVTILFRSSSARPPLPTPDGKGPPRNRMASTNTAQSAANSLRHRGPVGSLKTR